MDAALTSPGSLLKKLENIFHEAAGTQAEIWSKICGEFMETHRAFLEADQPSEELIHAHRTALKWMLRMTRMIECTVADPDYPDKRISDEIRGRLLQLEYSWDETHGNTMTKAESEKLLAQVFPG